MSRFSDIRISEIRYSFAPENYVTKTSNDVFVLRTFYKVESPIGSVSVVDAVGVSTKTQNPR